MSTDIIRNAIVIIIALLIAFLFGRENHLCAVRIVKNDFGGATALCDCSQIGISHFTSCKIDIEVKP